MSDTITTDRVRTHYLYFASEPGDAFNGELAEREEQFDRWLKSVRAAAWDEGARSRATGSFIRENLAQTLAKNPYKEETE